MKKKQKRGKKLWRYLGDKMGKGKNLLKKIGIGAVAVGGLFLGSCGRNYNFDIDGNEINYNRKTNNITICKEKDNIIWYSGKCPNLSNNIDGDELVLVKINKNTYGQRDSLVYPWAAEHFKYLKKEIREEIRKEEVRKAKEDLEILKK